MHCEVSVFSTPALEITTQEADSAAECYTVVSSLLNELPYTHLLFY